MRQIFNNLMALCSEPDSAFSFKDYFRAGQRFRIFNYRLASYTDFMKPDALEARGIMFLMDSDGSENPIKIVCRPPKKFFNVDENPLTMNLDFSKAVDYMHKMDGSLISSYMYGHYSHNLGLKSKGALFSDQAQWAEQWLHHSENKQFHLAVCDLTSKGWTVNMEFISPRNQIVVPYHKEELVILNIRNIETGMTLFKDQVYGHDSLPWVSSLKETVSSLRETSPSLSWIASLKGIEGFVIRFENELLVKIKTDEYLTLHKAKDGITVPRHLFEAVIMETTDDLKALFKLDPLALKRIADMEELAIPRYNHMVSEVENFYGQNKALGRKDFAIKGQKDIPEFFGLVMNKYLGKEPPFKEFAIKNYKVFGIPESKEEEDTDVYL